MKRCGNQSVTVMTHKMKLSPTAFKSISSGKKTVEMRLFDEKRAAINVGDEIEFENTDTRQKIKCTVINLERYKDFFELYSRYDKISIGYVENETADPRDMYAYYPPESIEKYGVLAIEIRLIK